MDRIGVFVPIVAMLAAAWMLASILRYLSQRNRGADRAIADQNASLANENEQLKGQVGRLEERIAVLERIATDPAERTAREIEQLR
jgi:cell division protein FtsB